MFVPLLFISICAVLVICVDVSTIYLVHAYIIKFQYVISTAIVMFMIYYWINLIKQLPTYSTDLRCLLALTSATYTFTRRT